MAFTGNSSFLNATAVAVDQSVSNKWQQVWTNGHPYLKIIEDKGTNFNKNFTMKRNTMVLPIIGDNQTTAADGVASGSGELSGMALNATNALSQAKYYIGHYRGNYTVLESEEHGLMNGEFGDILEAKAQQLLAGIHDVFSTDMASTTVDASDNSKCLGLYYVLSTSNSPGGINQSTDAQWAAYVKTSAGTWDLSLLDDGMDTIKAKQVGNITRPGMLDVLLCSIGTGNNVYGKVRNSIAPAERFENKDFEVKYGIENFVYRGAMGVMDPRIGTTLSGSIAMLNSSTWFVSLDKEPKKHAPVKVSGTDAYEFVRTAWAGIGCNDPGLNGLIRDIS